MGLGQRLKQARLAAGLSQRQLCGDAITRNMLSQIENGSAKPSMDTLKLLAGRLGKPISFFLEEDAVCSVNQKVMEAARQAFASGQFKQALEELEKYTPDEPMFDWEQGLLKAEALLSLAEQALREKRNAYAEHLLEQAIAAGEATPYYGPYHRQRWLLLMAQTESERGKEAARKLSVDAELMEIARIELPTNPERAAQVLDAATQKDLPRWNLLRGQAAVELGEYLQAKELLHRAEQRYPEQTAPLLEQCYRELGDYKLAYEYACKQRK